MIISLRSFDTYNRNARIYPALIAVAPALAALALLFSWSSLSVSNSIASIGLLVVLYAMSDFGRQQGKRLEPKLYKAQGGMPSVKMLWRNDTTFDEPAKERYRTFLAGKLGRPVPTAEEEERDQAAADGFYSAACTWLRENTRDKKKFDILFNELVSYGFRRNLLGLKWPAAGLNLMVTAVCAWLLWQRWPLNMDNDFTVKVIIVLAVAVIHAAYLLFAVTWRSAIEASGTYGRQLIISTEAFLAAAPKRRVKPKVDATST
jgi:hypothetical protein